MKRIILLAILPLCLSAQQERTQPDQDLVKNNDMLEISKNFMSVSSVHKMHSDAQRSLDRINNVNFAMKPRVTPVKPFDSVKVHHVYPLKIFLPEGSTVTSARLSNSPRQPTISQNVITVEVNGNFESGLLDLAYISGFNTQEAKYLSVKLDKYIPDNIESNLLYTQVVYYAPKRLDNNTILATLKPSDYSNTTSRVKYMGVTYTIHLVSVVADKEVIKRYRDEKYTNCALVYNDKTYNYYVE